MTKSLVDIAVFQLFLGSAACLSVFSLLIASRPIVFAIDFVLNINYCACKYQIFFYVGLQFAYSCDHEFLYA